MMNNQSFMSHGRYTPKRYTFLGCNPATNLVQGGAGALSDFAPPTRAPARSMHKICLRGRALLFLLRAVKVLAMCLYVGNFDLTSVNIHESIFKSIRKAIVQINT